MRALILVFFLSTLTTIWGYTNHFRRPSNRLSCEDVVKQGLCYCEDVLEKYGTGLANHLIKQCCTDDDEAKKVIVITNAGEQFVKMLNGVFEPLDFCDIVDKKDACPKCCAVNGNWGEWTRFSRCSASCGFGVKSRKRFCNNPSPANGGEDCPGSNIENRKCIFSKCPEKLCESFDGYHFDPVTRCCIKVFQTKKNFFGAKKKCMLDGGVLLKLDSTDKRDFLQTLVADNSAETFFIGARDINGHDEFEHLDHTPVKWIGKLPTSSNQDCVRYKRIIKEMDATFCSNVLKFVCERDVSLKPRKPLILT
ncbi:uncharacterized protein LOC126811666 [Patella vulgata]|uniref:uncharacterized protein LOC126811666 n=1 Tax=Patella vulgata TaxID=6465 RepID=UPI00218097D3|nr:uncharacterized protein LOC126811666 [Patella vulgata]